jgi:CheY-like chemotaxis protein
MEPGSTDVLLAPAPAGRASNNENSSVREPIASPLRILMAEDNVINQKVGKLILQRAGFNIDLVADGNEALEAHRTNPYDLILMDCQMPTMDGFEASRQIRQSPQPQPIIVAVTANALVGERERCLNAGMDDYLSKPFQAEQLVALVKKWIAKRTGARL